MTDGKDTAVKTKPFISKENAQNRPETIQRETVLGVSAFREQISNSAAKRRCPLCPVCRNTSRENGRSFLMSVAGRNTTSFLYSMLPEGIEKTMHPLKSRTAPPSKSKLHPLDGFLSKLRFFAKIPSCDLISREGFAFCAESGTLSARCIYYAPKT